ncbi:unnamed protein product [Zymoseptoria tritici ST99CH_1A5]|uniref:Major facilitator superfamily (MFS) profile domain-containing protein n=4 Tax=Zymoseptoria tritici TaxID=1047171 RepID=A0A1X7S130_ZYMT9|nr:unnamed protein product [Zymoseptoria tritici ST99CH_3D7]SMR56985.1 unnamed protein product [Zymoseptoria tritici ST99CH_1E4]SMY27035.1 unnamed protein product [Zymoseptoria tritici ST99CH_1A5]
MASDGRAPVKSSRVSAEEPPRIQPPSERTPLLPKASQDDDEDDRRQTLGKAIVLKLLFTSFLVAVSFSITQVPIIHVFGLMTCDEYYRTYPKLDPGPVAGRCRHPSIEASTARSVAFLGATTTIFGVLNLFYTGWAMKKWGVKTALLTSVCWPALRLVVQNVGVRVGYGLGILIIQASQVITIVGGPAGYILALNSFATEAVEARERTATLGRLNGCAFFGTALGYLVGGMLSDYFGLPAPFEVTLVLFVLSCIYVALALPSVPLHLTPESEKKAQSLASFFEPLKMFIPRKWELQDGRLQTEYGILLLGVGASMALLATGYIPVLLQMYATDVLDFGATENGWLISLNSLVRAVFLTFAFPIIISKGRAWLDRRQEAKDKTSREESASHDSTTRAEDPEIGAMGDETEPTEPVKPGPHEEASYKFDLQYTRWSILLDGILTAVATFTTQKWHMYLVAVLLPLAAGTGSAAKGTILQMCAPSERADALSAISLVEMVGRLSAVGVFGLIFSAFAEIGKPQLTFLANGAVAVMAFVVLCLTRFPPKGARRVVVGED